MSRATAVQFHSALKGVIKRAIIVMDALGDSEKRFQSTGQVWDRAIDDASMAYGYSEARVRFIPTVREVAQAEIVSDWLSWLGSRRGISGRDSMHLILAFKLECQSAVRLN